MNRTITRVFLSTLTLAGAAVFAAEPAAERVAIVTNARLRRFLGLRQTGARCPASLRKELLMSLSRHDFVLSAAGGTLASLLMPFASSIASGGGPGVGGGCSTCERIC